MKPAGYAVILIIIISVLAVDMHFSSSNAEYSMYNSNWNGTSLFAADLQDSGGMLLTDYRDLAGRVNSTLIIIEPDNEFTAEELRELRDYKNNGNIVFISDETGTSLSLLKVFGTPLSVEDVDLLSLDIEYNDPGFIICYTNGQDPLLTGVEKLALNNPSVADGGEALVTTSILSWVDENGNKKAEMTESLGKKAVLVKSGNVYLISDSGIFLNGVYSDGDMEDNGVFMKNLLNSSGKVYLDAAHSGISSEEGSLEIINIIRNSSIIKGVTIIIIVLLLLFVYREKT